MTEMSWILHWRLWTEFGMGHFGLNPGNGLNPENWIGFVVMMPRNSIVLARRSWKSDLDELAAMGGGRNYIPRNGPASAQQFLDWERGDDDENDARHKIAPPEWVAA